MLFLVATSNYVDRNIVQVLLEPIKTEFHLSDSMLGLLTGFSYTVFYVLFGLPVARWADHGNRRTIITLALTLWSLMTLCCGMAQTFLQLLLARVGVGSAESGAITPAHSLIGDYFPPTRRASAIAIFTSAATAGYLLGFAVGGYLAATLGWRTAFQIVGAPGLLLAIVVRVTLPEPRMSGITGYSIAKIETVRQSVSHLRRKRSFVRLVVASQLYFLFAYGVLSFVSSFLVRVLHLPLAQISVKYGLISASGTLIGTLGGGWMADHLVRRDVRWLAWICTLAFCITGPLYIFAFTSSQFLSFSLFAFAASVLIAIGLPTLFAAIHSVCGHMRRAVAIGIVLFSATFVGGGLGPLATGALSDVLTARYGVNGLRFALICMSCLLMFSGITFIFVAKAMPHDVEE